MLCFVEQKITNLKLKIIMIKKLLSLIFLGYCLLLLTGCASIVDGGPGYVNIRGPKDAALKIKDELGAEVYSGTLGEHATTVSLRRGAGYFQGKDYTVEVSQGDKKSTASITTILSPWYFGNIIFGGAIGLIAIDPATGAMWKLDPTELTLRFDAPAPVPALSTSATASTDQQAAQQKVHRYITPAASGYADIHDFNKSPIIMKYRDMYFDYIKRPAPKAMVTGQNNSIFSNDGPDAIDKAFDRCYRYNTSCWLYAVDNDVVWASSESRRVSRKHLQLRPVAENTQASALSQ